jgi:hypothetical protein
MSSNNNRRRLIARTEGVNAHLACHSLPGAFESPLVAIGFADYRLGLRLVPRSTRQKGET